MEKNRLNYFFTDHPERAFAGRNAKANWKRLEELLIPQWRSLIRLKFT